MVGIVSLGLGVLWAAATFALPADVVWIPPLRQDETLAAARLTAAEQRSIVEQLEATSFDVPDEWSREVRVRHIELGTVQGLLIRGTDRLCGGTGNCQTWIFTHAGSSRWLNGFESEAPIAASVGLDSAAAPIKDLVLTTNRSADAKTWIRYRFDGHHYRETECFDVADGVERAVRCH
jgi:hypothetical protein